MQLHPHFLFNTLNSILPLVFRDGEAASRTVVRLADLLRLSLQNETNDLIPLRQELDLLEVYLEIQKTRFQDRLTVRLDVPHELGGALVPNLILQPLVENAIKHGIAAKPGAGTVEVRVRRAGLGRLSLLVRDDGPGPARGRPPRRRRGRRPAQHARPPRAALRRRPRVRVPRRAGTRLRGRDEHPARRRAGRGPPARRAGARFGRADGDPGMSTARPHHRRSPAPRRSWRRPSAATPASRPTPARSSSSRAMLDEVLQLYPGTAVAVAIGDEIVWSTAFGFADVDRHRPVSRATQFRVYEVAMPLTATMMARLSDEGRIDLDAPIQRYVPGRPGRRRSPSPSASLAAHLSGARDFEDEEDAPAPCAAARDAVRRLPPQLFVRPSGLAYAKSRPGYLLLSAALESASGKSFGDLLAETIASPTGMSLTMVDDPRRFLPGRTLFYERGWFGLLRSAHEVDTSCRWGAGGLLSTTGDLVALRRGAAAGRDPAPRNPRRHVHLAEDARRRPDRLRPRLARRDRRARPPRPLARRPRRRRTLRDRPRPARAPRVA